MTCGICRIARTTGLREIRPSRARGRYGSGAKSRRSGKRYEVVSIVNEFLIAIWFIAGGLLFFPRRHGDRGQLAASAGQDASRSGR
ncbi:YrhK family protein [Saccharopolyspora sp. NPDC000995]